tara:strand:- start:55375 stop:57243 length:1869 start_codon:yes stop_codon:yes gene_type:complete
MKHLTELHTTFNQRLFFLKILCAMLFVSLIIGLGYQQIILNQKYKKQEQRQSLRRILQPGPRGSIYDRNHKLLVGTRPRFIAVVYLNELRPDFRKEYIKRVRALRNAGLAVKSYEVQKAARKTVLKRYLTKVNRILGRKNKVNDKLLEQHFSQRLLLPMPIIDDLEPHEYAKLIEQLPVNSPIQVYTDNARYYPYGSAAAHTLGYVVSSLDISEEGVPGEELTTFSLKGKQGKAGLERSFEEYLQGESGGQIWRVDPAGFQYECVEQKNPTQGEDLICSLDIDLQRAAEQAIRGKTGAVVAIEVASGEVLTLASSPTYNLNDLTPYIPTAVYNDINERGAWINRAIQGLYPPGSPFKMITASAALRHQLVDGHTLCDCQRTLQVGTRAFPCATRYGHGPLNLVDAIAKSCNIYFYQSALDMGIARLSEEAKLFGLDTATGIELPFETRHALVPTPAWKKRRGLGPWLGGDTANMSIGQGFLLTTPLNMACFAAALARGETRTKPTLIHNPNRPAVDHGGKPLGLTEEQYTILMDGMKRATESGTARRTQIDDIEVASKTGTAQTKVKGKDRDLAWFFGFAPADNPQIALVVMVEETEDSHNFWGSITAAPIAKVVLQHYFNK